MKTMSVEEARSIISWLDAGALAAAVWRLAEADEDGKDRQAAAGIDLVYGRVWMQAWSKCELPPGDPNTQIVLASCNTQQREATWRWLSEGLEVPPSEDVVVAEVEERAWREGIPWKKVETQIGRIYGESQAA